MSESNEESSEAAKVKVTENSSDVYYGSLSAHKCYRYSLASDGIISIILATKLPHENLLPDMRACHCT